MNRSVAVGLVLVLGASVLGCRSPKAKSEKSIYGMMQERANAITEAGGLAAVGMADSKVTSMAIDKANTKARVALAHIIETKVDSLKKDFAEEIGEGKASEYNSLFSAASKSVAHQNLKGTVPRDIKYDTSADGITTAYVLMVQDPKVVANLFESQANSQKSLYTRFRASQAFAELDEEVKKFEEFKKKDGGL